MMEKITHSAVPGQKIGWIACHRKARSRPQNLAAQVRVIWSPAALGDVTRPQINDLLLVFVVPAKEAAKELEIEPPHVLRLRSG
jgi:hypothetical protein